MAPIRTITMKERFEYLKNVFQEESGIQISFPEFMECLFSKLENEIREGKSGLKNYYQEKEGEKKPISDQTVEFKYDYDK
jgi:hypothetical protein